MNAEQIGLYRLLNQHIPSYELALAEVCRVARQPTAMATFLTSLSQQRSLEAMHTVHPDPPAPCNALHDGGAGGDADDTAARQMPRVADVPHVRDAGARYRVRSTWELLLVCLCSSSFRCGGSIQYPSPHLDLGYRCIIVARARIHVRDCNGE